MPLFQFLLSSHSPSDSPIIAPGAGAAASELTRPTQHTTHIVTIPNLDDARVDGCCIAPCLKIVVAGTLLYSCTFAFSLCLAIVRDQRCSHSINDHTIDNTPIQHKRLGVTHHSTIGPQHCFATQDIDGHKNGLFRRQRCVKATQRRLGEGPSASSVTPNILWMDITSSWVLLRNAQQNAGSKRELRPENNNRRS